MRGVCPGGFARGFMLGGFLGGGGMFNIREIGANKRHILSIDACAQNSDRKEGSCVEGPIDCLVQGMSLEILMIV